MISKAQVMAITAGDRWLEKGKRCSKATALSSGAFDAAIRSGEECIRPVEYD